MTTKTPDTTLLKLAKDMSEGERAVWLKAYRNKLWREADEQDAARVLEKLKADEEAKRSPTSAAPKTAKDMTEIERAQWLANHKKNFKDNG